MFEQSGHSEQATVDNLAAALPCKTPVSLLQELCMRRGISPKYDLLQIEGAVHEPTFVYRVTVGEFTASGSGQSKKKAKHAAAKAVLDVIIHGGGAGPASSGTLQHSNGGDSSAVLPNNGEASANELSSLVVSPYDDGIPGNPVGQLQELCMTRRWPPPTYELTAEEGFPHERTFSIACTIATYKETGVGKSKKLAKRQAAYGMMQKLRDMPQEHQPNSGLNEDEDEVLASDGSCLEAPGADSGDSLLLPGGGQGSDLFPEEVDLRDTLNSKKIFVDDDNLDEDYGASGGSYNTESYYEEQCDHHSKKSSGRKSRINDADNVNLFPSSDQYGDAKGPSDSLFATDDRYGAIAYQDNSETLEEQLQTLNL